MNKIGIIKEKKNKSYHIETILSKECKKCNLCDAKQDIWLKKDRFEENVTVGDKVKVEYSNKFSFIIFLVYLLPLIFFIAGALIFHSIFDSQDLSVIGSFIFFTVSLFFVRFLSKKFKKDIIPVVKKIDNN